MTPPYSAYEPLSEADLLRRRAQQMIEEAEHLERMAEPGPDGTVVRWTHQYSADSRLLTHVAVRDNGRWASSSGTGQRYAWHTLVKTFPNLAAGKYEIATGWTTPS